MLFIVSYEEMKRFNSENKGWKKGINQFSTMTDSEKSQYKGELSESK